MSASNSQPEPSFEQSLQHLEKLVERLEQGQLPLQESIDLFREGVQTARQCHTFLSDAQQVVEQLEQQEAADEPPGDSE